MSSTASLQAGKPVAEGEFRLDERRAREKLRNYQLPSPHHYILEFLKAAHLLEATRFEASIERSQVEVWFDGTAPGRRQIKRLYSAVFSSREEPTEQALRHLAIGVNAAQGAGIRELTIEVGGDESFAVVVGEEDVEFVESADGVDEGVRIRLDKKLHQSMLVRFFGQLKGQLPAGRLLYERARHSRVVVFVDGNQISRGLQLPEEVQGEQQVRRDDGEYAVGLAIDRKEDVVRLVQRGVLIDEKSRRAQLAPFAVRGIVDSARWKTDLSQQRLVEDDTWERVRRSIDRISLRALAEALVELDDADIREKSFELRRLVVWLLSGSHTPWASLLRVRRQLRQALQRLSVFVPAVKRDDGPERISFADTRCERESEDVFRYSTRRFDAIYGDPPAPPVVALCADDDAFDAVETFRDPSVLVEPFDIEAVDVTERLEKRAKAEENRRAWKSRSPFEFRGDNIQRGSAAGLTVEVGEKERVEAGQHIYFVKDDRVLSQEYFDADIRALRVAIRGDIPPNESFDGPDFSSERVHAAALEALRLIGRQLEEGDFSVEVLTALLGDFQEQLNRVFHLDWHDWPGEAVESPLGIAPPAGGKSWSAHPSRRAAASTRPARRVGRRADF